MILDATTIAGTFFHGDGGISLGFRGPWLLCHADTNSHPTVECHDESHVDVNGSVGDLGFLAMGLEGNAADFHMIILRSRRGSGNR